MTTDKTMASNNPPQREEAISASETLLRYILKLLRNGQPLPSMTVSKDVSSERKPTQALQTFTREERLWISSYLNCQAVLIHQYFKDSCYDNDVNYGTILATLEHIHRNNGMLDRILAQMLGLNTQQVDWFGAEVKHQIVETKAFLRTKRKESELTSAFAELCRMELQPNSAIANDFNVTRAEAQNLKERHKEMEEVLKQFHESRTSRSSVRKASSRVWESQMEGQMEMEEWMVDQVLSNPVALSKIVVVDKTVLDDKQSWVKVDSRWWR